MQITSKWAPSTRHWAQNLYMVLDGLILLDIFLQGFLIGASLFAGAAWGVTAHGFGGLVLLILSLLLALVGLAAQIPGRMKALGFVLFALVIVQLALVALDKSIPLLAALHPANAMILFGLSLFLLWRMRRVMQANA